MENVEAFGNFGVEIFKQFAPRLADIFGNLQRKARLNEVELHLDLRGRSAFLIDFGNFALEV